MRRTRRPPGALGLAGPPRAWLKEDEPPQRPGECPGSSTVRLRRTGRQGAPRVRAGLSSSGFGTTWSRPAASSRVGSLSRHQPIRRSPRRARRTGSSSRSRARRSGTRTACWASCRAVVGRSSPCAGDPVLSGRRPWCAASGVVRSLDLGEIHGRTFVWMRAAGLTPIPTGSPTRRGSCAAKSSTVRARRSLSAWAPATFTVTLDSGEPRRITGYTIAARTRMVRRRGCSSPPRVARRRACSRGDGQNVPERRFPEQLPTVLRESTCASPLSTLAEGGDRRIAADRSFRCMPTATRSPSFPFTVRALRRRYT